MSSDIDTFARSRHRRGFTALGSSGEEVWYRPREAMIDTLR